ncbi:rare lipoprotein A [Marinobacter daqiaonensis]|uniref:Endolytic peptidoglycan transglycosylase RlpA n=1 Tax=Marinobacter daqiaonensis TaxID=650891 RepID=A0A1I6J4U6_9GAMM|nr:septal ring lytic transglycosylase RlpA family protein [Marinobacter daqiaonensis]SFR73891.1 rare lipoprotein A [Marinobacter daqiaonensis]
MNKMPSLIVLILSGLVLAGCASAPPEKDHSARYTMKQDKGPSEDVDITGLMDATPRYEAPRNAGNKSPYVVWGKQYRVMSRGSADGYVERGIASWYGKKFHGHHTSNGEIYDMYKMSAAHKSLPIPSYARVTNLANGRSVVVRVNDRGPFHGDRLIDLSWAAAKKLGYLSQGTARVEVAAITVDSDGSMTLAGEAWRPLAGSAKEETDQEGASSAVTRGGLFVQLGSFSNAAPARRLEQELRGRTESPVRVRQVTTESGRFHRVQVGPFADTSEAEKALRRLASEGFPQAMVLTDNH